MSEKPQKRSGWSGAKGAVIGFIVGVLISGVGLFPEFAKRLAWAHGGGGGESAQWGEPLFYMIVLGILTAFIAAVIGGAMARAK